MTDLFDVLDATWPAYASHRAGPWLVREGRGGGKRVSAATPAGDWADADIPLAETAHAELGQVPLFLIRPADAALDAALASRGYDVVDPVNIYAAPVAVLAATPPKRMTTFPIWPMLAIMRDQWVGSGTGPERLANMERAIPPRTSILGRIEDRAAGVAFVAVHGDTAMLHALPILPEFRRKGLAANVLRAAAVWGERQGASQLALAVTRDNLPANALYASLGMQVVEQYHYRRAARR